MEHLFRIHYEVRDINDNSLIARLSRDITAKNPDEARERFNADSDQLVRNLITKIKRVKGPGYVG